jgi:hypothetical protein
MLKLSYFFHDLTTPTIPAPFALEWQVHNATNGQNSPSLQP